MSINETNLSDYSIIRFLYHTIIFHLRLKILHFNFYFVKNIQAARGPMLETFLPRLHYQY